MKILRFFLSTMSWHSTPTIFKANNDSKKNVIPIIDLFAGPGGLGEGFSALGDREGMSFSRSFSLLKKRKQPIEHFYYEDYSGNSPWGRFKKSIMTFCAAYFWN